MVSAIRIPDEHWFKVWRALIACGPLGCIGSERIYLVNDKQMRMLRRKKLPFEIVPLPDGRKSGGNHA